MTERILPSRNKKKKKQPAPKRLSSRLQGQAKEYPKGRVLRVSSTVYNFLSSKRKRKEPESWDNLLRRMFNIPQRKGEAPELHEVWLLRSTGETAITKALARGKAIRNAAREGKAKAEEPILVREVV